MDNVERFPEPGAQVRVLSGVPLDIYAIGLRRSMRYTNYEIKTGSSTNEFTYTGEVAR